MWSLGLWDVLPGTLRRSNRHHLLLPPGYFFTEQSMTSQPLPELETAAFGDCTVGWNSTACQSSPGVISQRSRRQATCEQYPSQRNGHHVHQDTEQSTNMAGHDQHWTWQECELETTGVLCIYMKFFLSHTCPSCEHTCMCVLSVYFFHSQSILSYTSKKGDYAWGNYTK